MERNGQKLYILSFIFQKEPLIKTSSNKPELTAKDILNDLDNKQEKAKAKAYPIADPKLTVKILDLIQQAMHYKQVCLIFVLVKNK